MTVTSKGEIIYFFQGKKKETDLFEKWISLVYHQRRVPIPLGQSLDVEGNK